MGLALFHSVFLVLVGIKAVTARVEPPTNVTLRCHNLVNILEWSYENVVPGLKFRVDIGAYYKFNPEGFKNVTWVEPPALQANVSFLSDPADTYFLLVTAVVDGQESDPSPGEDGISFSYEKNALANHKCFVDLPPVNFTTLPHDKVLLQFQHPWLVYHEKLPGSKIRKARRKKSHDAQISEPLPVFKYEVDVINQTQGHYSFTCEEKICEKTLQVDATQEKHCVEIKGDLQIGGDLNFMGDPLIEEELQAEGGLQKMLVQGSQVYCARPLRPSDYTYIYILVGLLVFTTIVALLLMVYCKTTKPPKEISPPDSMAIVRPMAPNAIEPVPDTVIVSDVALNSPTPLLSSTDEEDRTDFTPAVTHSTDYHFRMPIGLSEDEGVCNAMQVGQVSKEGSAYMQGNGLDEEEIPAFDEVSSGYESRAVLVELGPDDMAEGYRG